MSERLSFLCFLSRWLGDVGPSAARQFSMPGKPSEIRTSNFEINSCGVQGGVIFETNIANASPFKHTKSTYSNQSKIHNLSTKNR